MRKWKPPLVPVSEEWSVVYQVVLPKPYRSEVLRTAHNIHMGGHLGAITTCEVDVRAFRQGTSSNILLSTICSVTVLVSWAFLCNFLKSNSSLSPTISIWSFFNLSNPSMERDDRKPSTLIIFAGQTPVLTVGLRQGGKRNFKKWRKEIPNEPPIYMSNMCERKVHSLFRILLFRFSS